MERGRETRVQKSVSAGAALCLEILPPGAGRHSEIEHELAPQGHRQIGTRPTACSVSIRFGGMRRERSGPQVS